MKKVLELNLNKNNLPIDLVNVVNSFDNVEYNKTQGKSQKGLFKYVKHFHLGNEIIDEDIVTIIHLMNEAIEVLALSVDKTTQVIDTVHYIISQDESRIIIHLQMKGDEVSHIVIPRFIGRKFSNIEALRRVSTNLSGQYNIKTRLYI